MQIGRAELGMEQQPSWCDKLPKYVALSPEAGISAKTCSWGYCKISVLCRAAWLLLSRLTSFLRSLEGKTVICHSCSWPSSLPACAGDPHGYVSTAMASAHHCTPISVASYRLVHTVRARFFAAVHSMLTAKLVVMICQSPCLAYVQDRHWLRASQFDLPALTVDTYCLLALQTPCHECTHTPCPGPGHMLMLDWDHLLQKFKLGVPIRDMRLMDPNLLTSETGKILVRDNAIVVSVEHVRVICTADMVIIPQDGFEHNKLNQQFNSLLQEHIIEAAQVGYCSPGLHAGICASLNCCVNACVVSSAATMQLCMRLCLFMSTAGDGRELQQSMGVLECTDSLLIMVLVCEHVCLTQHRPSKLQALIPCSHLLSA